MTTLNEAFEEVLGDIVIDNRLVDAIFRYQSSFINRDAEHLAFFASNLIGVHVIRFRTSDAVRFFRDVLRTDYVEVERKLKTVTTIVQEYKVISDAMNLTLMYLIHRVATAKKLSDSARKRGAYDLALIFFYRCIAIRQSEYFHFPADPKIAQAAYAELSKKFLIKRLGTWRAVMEYRAKDLLDPKGLHYEKLVAFTDDTAVTYAISDSENRIRNLYKAYCAVFHQVREAGGRIESSSSTQIDLEGVEKLKERVKSVEQSINNLRLIIHDAPSFVKPDLVGVILSINTNTSQRMLVSTLTWMADHISQPKWHNKIDDYMKSVVIHSFHLVEEMDLQNTRDYPALLIALKNLYLSTRSQDRDLIRIRKLGEELIRAANGNMNSSLMMSTRTATILYITLRALSGSK
jgi:hypothetical protein